MDLAVINSDIGKVGQTRDFIDDYEASVLLKMKGLVMKLVMGNHEQLIKSTRRIASQHWTSLASHLYADGDTEEIRVHDDMSGAYK